MPKTIVSAVPDCKRVLKLDTVSLKSKKLQRITREDIADALRAVRAYSTASDYLNSDAEVSL